MTKTVENYMNDPRILNDREIMEAPRCIREIHAIRLKIQDEYDVFSPEYEEHCHKTTEAVFAELGIKPPYAELPFHSHYSTPITRAPGPDLDYSGFFSPRYSLGVRPVFFLKM
jgi:protoheme ferro-lyase